MDEEAKKIESGLKQNASKVAVVIEFITEFVKIAVISAAIILPIRFFVIQPFYVKGPSMEPNFYENEYLIIDELSYHLRAPARGEVVVFRFPDEQHHYLIKRIIGLPGDSIAIRGNTITVKNKDNPNGLVLNEAPYGPKQVDDNREINVSLSANQYYVLGDNRPVSYDSEKFGPINADAIVGRVALRGLPLDRITLFSTPSFGSNN